jgi:hypothetical protein
MSHVMTLLPSSSVDTELTYTLGADGRWIESEHHWDIIDINMVLSPNVSDQAILDWLSPPAAAPCIMVGDDCLA